MLTVNSVIDAMERFAPISYSDEYRKKYGGYDNCGLMTGSCESKLNGAVVLCVDVTDGAIDFALEHSCNMIVSHHPFIFTPLSAVTEQSLEGRKVMRAIRAGLNVYSSHLNLDIARGGVNDALCEALGVKDADVLFPVADAGMGRIGKIPPCRYREFAARAQKAFQGDRSFWAIGSKEDEISSVALIAGGGGGDMEYIAEAGKRGANVYVSSEFKHHIILAAKEMGLNLISASHYEEEKFVLEKIAKILAVEGIQSKIYYGGHTYIE